MDGHRASARLRVFLLDEHESVRRSPRELLKSEGDIEVAGEAVCASEAMVWVPAVRPQVAVLDVRLPDKDGVTSCGDYLRSSARPARPRSAGCLRRARVRPVGPADVDAPL